MQSYNIVITFSTCDETMKSRIRKIGNSRGVLIPASFLSACEIESEIELRLDGGRIVIEPLKAPRDNWFTGFCDKKDDDAWAGLVTTDLEDEDWQW
jgi:antitoxin MazE